MVLELFYYIIFSTIEGIGVFYLTLTLFRYKIKEHLFPIVIINILISFLSYNLQQDSSYTWITPIAQLILLAFFIQILIRIPLIWSVITAFTGIILFGLIQTLLLFALDFIQIMDFNFVQLGTTSEAYLFQAIEAIVIYPLSYFLYKRGYGFTFDFGKFSFKNEKVWVTILLVLSFASFIYIFLMRNLILATMIFLICLVFYLIYHFRKEREF